MKERIRKIELGDISLTVTYFADAFGVGRREPLGEIFDNISSIHRHAEHEIFFLWGGEMELVTESENCRFGDSVVVLPPDLGHYTVIDAEKVFVIYLNIDRAEGESGKKLVKLLSSGVVSLKVSEDEKFYLEKLRETQKSIDFSHLLSLLFSEVITRLSPEILGGEGSGEGEGKYAFAIEEYIERHYSERIRLRDLAEYLHLCEKQVSRVIKREYGCSFSEYVNHKRLSVAVMMLRHTDMTVTAIAGVVGFDNDNYFYRVFRENFGLTPNEYREQKNGS